MASFQHSASRGLTPCRIDKPYHSPDRDMKSVSPFVSIGRLPLIVTTYIRSFELKQVRAL
jgi:hypothetical protein